ncbi:MFS transporter [Streptomyces sp. NBC_00388]|uniref:MFS transporter n=1 Tax=Streptomyces sp. NBC_00388 TaxID=2975735 RepID=UPI002E1F734B
MTDIATQHTDGPPRRRRIHPAWPVAAVSALAIVAAGAFATMTGLFTGPLHREFGWSHGSIGLAASVNMVVYGIVAPFSAALMDRFGMRRVVGTALVAVAAGALLSTMMSTLWQYVLTWGVLIGLGSGAMALTFAATVTQRWFVRRRGLVSGVLTAAGVFGQFAFLPGQSWVVAGHGWRTAAALPALAALAALPLVLLLRDHPADAGAGAYGALRPTPRPRPVPGAATRTVRVLGRAARGAPFWLLAATFAICGASTNGVMWTHFTPAAHDHGMPATAASSLLALVGVFNVAGTVFSGWLTDRLDPRRLLACCYALRGAALFCLPVLMSATVRPSMVGFVVVFGLLDVATVPPTLALCRALYGADSAIVFGWVAAAHQLGAGAAAFLGGVARDTFGSYDPLWAAAGAVCGAGSLLALVIARPAVRCGAAAGPGLR